MALPKIDLPLFELTIPSSGKVVNYRPFTVKEEKILLIAQESKDLKQIIIAIKQIINNCVQDADVEKMPMFDLEYIMLNLRAKSVNNEVTFTIEDPDTKERVLLALDINNIKIQYNENHLNKIKLNDEYHIIMRYPTINELSNLDGSNMGSDQLLNIMLSCIDILASTDGENIYKLSDFTQAEIKDFVEGLSSASTKEIQKFFETVPVLRIEIPYKLKDGSQKTFVLQGNESFFL
jgi:plasmid maintenance system killer protein